LRTLFYLSSGLAQQAGPGQTDAAQMAALTLIPAPVWAALWTLLALALLWVALGPRRARRASSIVTPVMG
jgi:hypothetical protein